MVYFTRTHRFFPSATFHRYGCRLLLRRPRVCISTLSPGTELVAAGRPRVVLLRPVISPAASHTLRETRCRAQGLPAQYVAATLPRLSRYTRERVRIRYNIMIFAPSPNKSAGVTRRDGRRGVLETGRVAASGRDGSCRFSKWKSTRDRSRSVPTPGVKTLRVNAAAAAVRRTGRRRVFGAFRNSTGDPSKLCACCTRVRSTGNPKPLDRRKNARKTKT